MDAHLSWDLPSPPEAVFDHLTVPDLVTAWWPTGAATDPVAGGRYHLWWDGPDWHLRGTYLEVERPSALVWTWAWDHEELPNRIVSMTLSRRQSEGTRLDIVHEAGTVDERDSYVEGWQHFLAKLEAVLGSGS